MAQGTLCQDPFLIYVVVSDSDLVAGKEEIFFPLVLKEFILPPNFFLR